MLFFTGLGKFKRIVLFDNLVEEHTEPELVGVLAHEIGHYKMGHIWTGLLVRFGTAGIVFFLLSLLLNNKILFEAFGMHQVSVYGSLTLLGILFTPLHAVLQTFQHWLSRKQETQADRYAVRTIQNPKAFIQALKKLAMRNLSNLTPHPWAVAWRYSHPPVLDRIQAIQAETFGSTKERK